MDFRISNAAMNLRMGIERHYSGEMIYQQTQELVRALNGTRDISDMTPQAVAIYLTALVLSQPHP